MTMIKRMKKMLSLFVSFTMLFTMLLTTTVVEAAQTVASVSLAENKTFYETVPEGTVLKVSAYDADGELITDLSASTITYESTRPWVINVLAGGVLIDGGYDGTTTITATVDGVSASLIFIRASLGKDSYNQASLFDSTELTEKNALSGAAVQSSTPTLVDGGHDGGKMINASSTVWELKHQNGSWDVAGGLRVAQGWFYDDGVSEFRIRGRIYQRNPNADGWDPYTKYPAYNPELWPKDADGRYSMLFTSTTEGQENYGFYTDQTHIKAAEGDTTYTIYGRYSEDPLERTKGWHQYTIIVNEDDFKYYLYFDGELCTNKNQSGVWLVGQYDGKGMTYISYDRFGDIPLEFGIQGNGASTIAYDDFVIAGNPNTTQPADWVAPSEVSVSVSGNGKITTESKLGLSASNEWILPCGENEFSVVPDEGYALASLIYNNVNVTDLVKDNKITLDIVEGDSALYAEFVPRNSNAPIRISLSENTTLYEKVPENTFLKIRAFDEDGNVVTDLSDCSVSYESSRPWVMDVLPNGMIFDGGYDGTTTITATVDGISASLIFIRASLGKDSYNQASLLNSTELIEKNALSGAAVQSSAPTLVDGGHDGGKKMVGTGSTWAFKHENGSWDVAGGLRVAQGWFYDDGESAFNIRGRIYQRNPNADGWDPYTKYPAYNPELWPKDADGRYSMLFTSTTEGQENYGFYTDQTHIKAAAGDTTYTIYGRIYDQIERTVGWHQYTIIVNEDDFKYYLYFDGELSTTKNVSGSWIQGQYAGKDMNYISYERFADIPIDFGIQGNGTSTIAYDDFVIAGNPNTTQPADWTPPSQLEIDITGGGTIDSENKQEITGTDSWLLAQGEHEFTITPDEGYILSSLIYNNKGVTELVKDNKVTLDIPKGDESVLKAVFIEENAVDVSAYDNQQPLRLYYDEEAPYGGEDLSSAPQPTDEDDGWERWSVPIGNGYMGVNVFGRTETERLQITENSLVDYYNTNTGGVGGLSNFAEVYFDFGHENSAVSDYSRDLILDDGTAHVSYVYDGVTYNREIFASYPDKVTVVKLDASEAGNISFTLRAEIPYLEEYTLVNGYEHGRTGTVTAEGDTITLGGLFGALKMKYEGQMKVIPEGGELIANEDGSLTLTGADSAYVIIAVGTNYKVGDSAIFTVSSVDAKQAVLEANPDCSEKVSSYMAEASAKSYETLLNNHKADYKELFGRVKMNVGTDEYGYSLTTDKLLDEYKAGTHSPYLEALYFQYGRYLLICSSRKGTLPPNLQGIWNRYKYAPWTGGYWHNINVQMNYWPVFNTNMAELFDSYVDYFNAYLPQAQALTKVQLNQDHSENLTLTDTPSWGISTSAWPYTVSAPYCASTDGYGTGPLMAKSFAEYYNFTQDKEKLKETLYPAVLGSALFTTQIVHDFDGTLLASPSASPEQVHNGSGYKTVGTAWDQMNAYEMHKEAINMAEILGKENDSDILLLKERIEKLDPVVIGASGQVKEYREEKYYGDIGQYTHRHISQLVGLYPGTIINSTTPAWLDAAAYTLTERGDQSTGWAMAHRFNLWTRTKRGDRAYDLYRQLLKTGTNNNLWDVHPPFQIDGNLGGTAAVAEMLLQSHEGYIEPLAAVPDEWSEGSYSGLVARGNFEVAAKWSDNQMESIKIISNAGEACKVKYYNIASATVTASDGSVPVITAEGADIISFETKEGVAYTITNIPEYTKVTAPTDLSAAISDDNSSVVNLSWTQSDDAATYSLYCAEESSPDYTLIASGLTQASYTYNVPADMLGTQKVFKVTAVNSDGRESGGATDLIEEFVDVKITGLASDIVLSDVSYDGEILVALYDSSDKLISVTTYTPASEISLSLDDTDYSYAVVMWWSELAELKPRTNAVRINKE